MYKVVYNACYGGFALSDAARYWLKSRGAEFASWFRDIPRHHPLLVECVEALSSACYRCVRKRRSRFCRRVSG